MIRSDFTIDGLTFESWPQWKRRIVESSTAPAQVIENAGKIQRLIKEDRMFSVITSYGFDHRAFSEWAEENLVGYWIYWDHDEVVLTHEEDKLLVKLTW